MTSAPRRVGLVGCVKGKLDHAAPAQNLYTSPLFGKRRRYVERTCEQWHVLSALHGLLRPDEPVAPYDKTLNDASWAERRRWSQLVLSQLDRELGPVGHTVFEVHAGKNYVDFGLVAGLEDRGAIVEWPVKGLPMGKQLAFYGAHR